MKSAKEFYQLRDLRTGEFSSVDDVACAKPIHVSVSEKISKSQAGQVALLALVNQLARIHRRISTSVPLSSEIPLLTRGFCNTASLADELYGIMARIDPFGSFSHSSAPEPDAVTISFGASTESATIFLGVQGSVATVSKNVQSFDTSNSGAIRGAALASCLGACAAFRQVFMGGFSETSFSIWNFMSGNLADLGPTDVKPLALDRILVAGAGAICSGLCYWCEIFGDSSSWQVVDGDILALHNTNRGLTFFPEDTDWFGQQPKSKVEIAKRHINAEPLADWINKYDFSKHQFDAILCLANEYNVRYEINFLQSPIFLQATTGKNWLAQLHRHIPKLDDCIFCRTASITTPKFGCSTAKVVTNIGQTDAALPFLSALSSLTLIIALQRYQEGLLQVDKNNDWRFDMLATAKPVASGSRECKSGCTINDFWRKTR